MQCGMHPPALTTAGVVKLLGDMVAAAPQFHRGHALHYFYVDTLVALLLLLLRARPPRMLARATVTLGRAMPAKSLHGS